MARTNAKNWRRPLGGAVCLAAAVALALVFRELGWNAGQLLPTQGPVLVAGLAFGPLAGLMAGFLAPLLVFLLTGTPALYPFLLTSVLELSAYGVFSGLFHRRLSWSIPPAQVTAMLLGRALYGASMWLFLGLEGRVYAVQDFWQTAFVSGLPGIALWLALVPLVVLFLEALKIAPSSRR